MHRALLFAPPPDWIAADADVAAGAACVGFLGSMLQSRRPVAWEAAVAEIPRSQLCVALCGGYHVCRGFLRCGSRSTVALPLQIVLSSQQFRGARSALCIHMVRETR